MEIFANHSVEHTAQISPMIVGVTTVIIFGLVIVKIVRSRS